MASSMAELSPICAYHCVSPGWFGTAQFEVYAADYGFDGFYKEWPKCSEYEAINHHKGKAVICESGTYYKDRAVQICIYTYEYPSPLQGLPSTYTTLPTTTERTIITVRPPHIFPIKGIN